MTNLIGWVCVISAWLLVGQACLQTTQGTYEDHSQIADAQRARPMMLRPRGLSRWLLWVQVQRIGAVPWQSRLVQLGLVGVLAGLTGLLAHRLGLTSWVAAGVLALHPLMVETVATISGRAELLAAIGVVSACLCVLAGRYALGVLCLAVGVLGKDSAIVGIVLVPLTLLVHQPQRVRWSAIGFRIAVLVAGCWWMRGIGTSAISPLQDAGHWALLQSGAAFRLMTLAVWPHGLTVDYDYDALSRWWFLASAASLAVLTWIAWTLWDRWRLAAFSLAWVLLVCLPRLIVQTPKSYLNEHQFTLAVVGVALGLAALLQAGQEFPFSTQEMT